MDQAQLNDDLSSEHRKFVHHFISSLLFVLIFFFSKNKKYWTNPGKIPKTKGQSVLPSAFPSLTFGSLMNPPFDLKQE